MSLMLTEPKAFTSGNYALESGGRFYRQRTGKVRAIVMHVTAGLQDLGMEGTDESAEGTNRWALSSGAQVSWHRIADSDGVERCLPSWATAWHAEGYNSNTVGEEISNVDARWDNKPADWVTWTLWWAAVGVADWVVTYKVPLRRATQAELDRAIATDGAPVGFIDHSRLSTNRRDPGATFPWDRFFTYVAAVIDGATSPEEDDMPLSHDDKVWVRGAVRDEVRRALKLDDDLVTLSDARRIRLWGANEDGTPKGPESISVTRALGFLVGNVAAVAERQEAHRGENREQAVGVEAVVKDLSVRAGVPEAEVERIVDAALADLRIARPAEPVVDEPEVAQ